MTRRQWIVFGVVCGAAFVTGGALAWLAYAVEVVYRADEERQRG